MKCYYHSDIDAVGTCSQCGKAACRDCIEDIGGALLCKDCIAMAEKTVAVEDELAVKKAKTSIMWSWVVTVVLSLLLVPMMYSGFAREGKAGLGLFVSILIVYVIWSTYWGWKVVFRWWKEFLGRLGCFLIANPVTWILLIVLFFYIPLIGASIYGCYGGGIYQYLKYRRIARSKY